MADSAISDVVWDAQFTAASIQCGEPISKYDVCYRGPNGKYMLAHAGDDAADNPEYMAIEDGALDAFIPAMRLEGTVAMLTATPAVAQGDRFVLSSTPGKIAPQADLTSGHSIVDVGTGDAANKVLFSVRNTKVKAP